MVWLKVAAVETSRPKTKMFDDNPYICDTPSPSTAVDINGTRPVVAISQQNTTWLHIRRQ